MVWKLSTELTQSELYNLISDILIILIIIFVVIFILVKSRANIRFFRKLTIFSEKHQKGIKIITLTILIIIILLFGILRYMINDLDESTKVKVEEKILIIEIDDYWNIDEALQYFERYGYTLERYRSVSNIIDKYGFTATLGVTPFIFVEDIRENFPLS